MRITRLYTQLDDFAVPMKRKYKLRNYSYNHGTQNREPVIFFGCYNKNAQKLALQHGGLLVIVWAGSDSMNLKNAGGFVRYLKKNSDRIFHIAYSHWIKADLEEVGLEYFEIPIFPVEFDRNQFTVEPLGEYVYHYTAPQAERKPFYGTDTIEAIKKRTRESHILSNKFIITNARAHPRSQLHHIYKKCFVGVRLTSHDNMGISCVEMSLMGRRSIFNGNIPGAIHYNSRDEVYDLIMEELQYAEPDRLVAEEMWDLIALDKEQWLDTDFYK